MKTKLLSVICLLSSVLCLQSSVISPLVDMTPGSFIPGSGFTPPIFKIFDFMERKTTFLDSAANYPPYNGWVSLYGLLHGADFFATDLIGRDTSSAFISWNMANAPDGYWVSMIMVEGQTTDGTYWMNIYGVHWDDRFNGQGLVILPSGSYINDIAMFGLNPATVPDKGSTLLLFAIAWIVLAPASSLLFGHFWKRRS